MREAVRGTYEQNSCGAAVPAALAMRCRRLRVRERLQHKTNGNKASTHKNKTCNPRQQTPTPQQQNPNPPQKNPNPPTTKPQTRNTHLSVVRVAAQARGAMPASACTQCAASGEEGGGAWMEQEEEGVGPCRVWVLPLPVAPYLNGCDEICKREMWFVKGKSGWDVRGGGARTP